MDAARSDTTTTMRASTVRRAVAWLIDFLLVMLPALALIGLALSVILHGLPGYIGAVAAEAGWAYLMRLITGVGSAPGSALFSEWAALALPLLCALLAMPLIQFVYLATLLGWRRRTVGQAIMDTRVDSLPPRGSRVRRALLTTMLETGIVSVAWIAITLGQFTIGLLVWAGAIGAFWVNAFIGLGPKHRTIVDRLAGTAVVRTSLYADAARRSAAIAQQATVTAVTAAHATRQLTADAGAVTAQLARGARKRWAATASSRTPGLRLHGLPARARKRWAATAPCSRCATLMPRNGRMLWVRREPIAPSSWPIARKSSGGSGAGSPEQTVGARPGSYVGERSHLGRRIHPDRRSC